MSTCEKKDGRGLGRRGLECAGAVQPGVETVSARESIVSASSDDGHLYRIASFRGCRTGEQIPVWECRLTFTLPHPACRMPMTVPSRASLRPVRHPNAAATIGRHDARHDVTHDVTHDVAP